MLWLVHTAILSRKWNKESVEKIPFQKSNWNFIDLNRIFCKLNVANICSMKLVFQFVKSAGEIVNGNAHTSFLSFQIRSIAFTKLCRFQRRTHSTVMATGTKQIQEKWSKYKQKTGLMGRGGGGGGEGEGERSFKWEEWILEWVLRFYPHTTGWSFLWLRMPPCHSFSEKLKVFAPVVCCMFI